MRLFVGGVEQKCSFFKVFSHAIMNPFLTAISLWSIIYSYRLVINAEPLIQMVPYLNDFIIYAWASLYLFGGSLMLLGSILLDAKISAAGNALFASSAFLSAIFLFSSHMEGYQWQAFTMCLFASAALLRVYHLIRGEILVWTRR